MAQLLLTTAASAVGAIANSGLGATIARSVAGVAAGVAANSFNTLIFGPRRRTVEGPRLESVSIQASTEGAGILRVFGRARIAGQLIWATPFRETRVTATQTSGGKGGPSTRIDTTEFRYSASFALGLCEGVIDRIARVWADGRPYDISGLNFRVYQGTDDQTPDDLIAATEGDAPAFRGLAYIVFEDLPLGPFGNRLPQLTFEIERTLGQDDPDSLEQRLTAVSMIPGSGEFVYGTTPVQRAGGEGVEISENQHNNGGVTDFVASLDGLQGNAPNVRAVSLIVSWFGDTLDVRYTSLRPGVDSVTKQTMPYDWRVGGLDRGGAYAISQINGNAAFGGTPADRSVVEAIQLMNARGLEVMFHPFILMDAPGFPWRGRLAPYSGAGTRAARDDIERFFGLAEPRDFTIAGGEVLYSGPNEFSFRRFILHYAHLCKLAGGVESFLLGSELRELTTSRVGPDDYPAVAQLVALARDVRAVLGPETKISYGADWSEYFGHQPADGSGDVYFHLDPLWASADIDFIGIDNYLPLSDWRDGFGHLDAAITDDGRALDYLKGNIRAGERFDWFYASEADRDAQIRTPITDGAHGEHWIFRAKDFENWWSNPHHNRPGGVRSAVPTAFVPRSKPFRFTEIGCPAVDKGANAPNVFVDPRSTESALPPYSNGTRDDLMQRRFLEAQLSYWADTDNNPVSPLYGGPMVAADRFYIYAVDARPFPFFPARDDIWGDGPNWETGHWLNGRLGRAPLDRLVATLAAPVSVETRGLNGVLSGYVIDRPLSPREAIDPLADLFQFDMVETGAGLTFRQRLSPVRLAVSRNDLVDSDGGAFTIRISEARATPTRLRLSFIDEGADYRPAVVQSIDPGRSATNGGFNAESGNHDAGLSLPAIMNTAEAEARARAVLADAAVMREAISFALPPSALHLTPGDILTADDIAPGRRYRIVTINDGAARRVDAVRLAPSVYDAPTGRSNFADVGLIETPASPVWVLLDLPLLRDGDDPQTAQFGAFGDPWAGARLFRDQAGATLGGSGSPEPVLLATAPVQAGLGRLVEALPPGPSGRWIDRPLRIRLSVGQLAGRDDGAVLAGANALAVASASGTFEVMQFADARLDSDGSWVIGRLLRGQAGTEDAARVGAPAGARLVLINGALAPVPFALETRDQTLALRAGPVGADIFGPAYRTGTAVWTARALRPLAPVRLAARGDGGDLALSWIRRTRIGGDSWAAGEVPLAENIELYRVEIADETGVRRTLEVSEPRLTYTAAAIAADFGAGGPGGPVTIRVAQVSDSVGAGLVASLVIDDLAGAAGAP